MQYSTMWQEPHYITFALSTHIYCTTVLKHKQITQLDDSNLSHLTGGIEDNNKHESSFNLNTKGSIHALSHRTPMRGYISESTILNIICKGVDSIGNA